MSPNVSALTVMPLEVHAQTELDLPRMEGFAFAEVGVVATHITEIRWIVEGHGRCVHRHMIEDIAELEDDSRTNAPFFPDSNVLRNRSI